MNQPMGGGFRRNNNRGGGNFRQKNRGKFQNSGGRRGGQYGPNPAQVRAQALKLREKYLNQARDALSAGDRVEAEYAFQHADHYLRVINELSPKPFEQEESWPQQEAGMTEETPEAAEDVPPRAASGWTHPAEEFQKAELQERQHMRRQARQQHWQEAEGEEQTGEYRPRYARNPRHSQDQHEPRRHRPYQPQGEEYEQESRNAPQNHPQRPSYLPQEESNEEIPLPAAYTAPIVRRPEQERLFGESETPLAATPESEGASAPRRRGRPRKNPLPE